MGMFFFGSTQDGDDSDDWYTPLPGTKSFSKENLAGQLTFQGRLPLRVEALISNDGGTARICNGCVELRVRVSGTVDGPELVLTREDPHFATLYQILMAAHFLSVTPKHIQGL